MKIGINRAGTQPSEEQISALEAFLRTTLDKDYLDFLVTYNGAVPEANIFRISRNNSSGVNRFIPIEKIQYEATLLDEVVGSVFFPIAYAEGGNYVCLPFSAGQDRGVYFYDHEIAGLTSITKIANSLRDFLSQLEPFDSSKVILESGQVKKAWIDPRFLK